MILVESATSGLTLVFSQSLSEACTWESQVNLSVVQKYNCGTKPNLKENKYKNLQVVI
jgi:hypothetical protein